MAVVHLDLDESKSVLSVDTWMRFTWVDEFLKWKPEDYDNLSQIHFAIDEIWRPDVFLYNR